MVFSEAGAAALAEEPEIKPQMDFRALFNEKLNSIQPAKAEDAKWAANFYKNTGIDSVKRKAIALAFRSEGNEGYELYAEDPKNIKDLDFAHPQVKKELIESLKANGMKLDYAYHAYVIQDADDKIYLLMEDESMTDVVNAEAEGEDRKDWMELLQRYNIENIFGRFKEQGKTFGSVRKVILKREDGTVTEPEEIEESNVQKMLVNERTNAHLNQIAQKYKMTNTQFLRFHTRVRAYLEHLDSQINSQTSTENNEQKVAPLLEGLNYEALAQDVIAEDRE